MKRLFYSLSISNKLAFVFLLLMFMMGVGGLVGLYNANELTNVTKRLYRDSFKRGETLSLVENEFLSSRQELFLHTIISDRSSKSYLEASVEERRNKIERLLLEYKSMGLAPSQEATFRDLVANLGKYWHVHLNVEKLSRAGDRDSALSIIRMEGNKTFTDTITSLKELIKEEQGAAFADYSASDYFARVILAVTLGFTVLAIVFGGVLWLALTRSMVKPILAIEEAAMKVAQGDFKQRAPVMTDDETGKLAVAFNRMAESLEDYYATLEKKVEERTRELEKANRELTDKKRELETANIELHAANRMKSQFLANVSHELRTPLNSIIGFSELLEEKAFGDLNERQTQYVEFIRSSGGHLLQLINNILDLSSIEAGRVEVAATEFSVSEALGEILGIVKPMAHSRDITIETRAAPASPKLRADKAKFKHIMFNLLTNAVKFNNDGGHVYLDWETTDEPSGLELKRYILFKIRDTGVGIAEEDRERVFRGFEQIDSSATREYGGAGLGLVLTKRLVELHGGEIWFDSAPGEGTTFYVKLPQGTEEIDAPVLTSAFRAASPGADSHRLVLIASESPDINHLLQIYLAGDAYDVVVAADGVDLVRKAKEHKPFVIITGIMIPKKDGWDVLKELKADATLADTPIIIISSTDNRELGLSLGAAEYLEKPVNRKKLLGALARLAPPADTRGVKEA